MMVGGNDDDDGGKSVWVEAVLVAAGVVMVVVYNARVAYRVWKAPATTELGLFHLALHSWARSTLKDGLKSGIFVVQTMRNSIMSSTILATGAVTLTTMVGLVLINEKKILASGKEDLLMFGERGLIVGPQIKLAALVPCFMIASMCYVRSATFYSDASLWLGMLSHPDMILLAQEHIKKSLVWASLFRCIGSRAFFISFPLLLWLYGPMPMFCSSLLTVVFLHLQDSTHNKLTKLQSPIISSPWNDQLAVEESPLISIGPLPPDSICLFCPHN